MKKITSATAILVTTLICLYGCSFLADTRPAGENHHNTPIAAHGPEKTKNQDYICQCSYSVAGEVGTSNNTRSFFANRTDKIVNGVYPQYKGEDDVKSLHFICADQVQININTYKGSKVYKLSSSLSEEDKVKIRLKQYSPNSKYANSVSSAEGNIVFRYNSSAAAADYWYYATEKSDPCILSLKVLKGSSFSGDFSCNNMARVTGKTVNTSGSFSCVNPKYAY